MKNKEYTCSVFRTDNITATIEGYTSMPFWEHDLKFALIIGLLETIDLKDYHNAGMYEDYWKSIKKVEELLNVENF